MIPIYLALTLLAISVEGEHHEVLPVPVQGRDAGGSKAQRLGNPADPSFAWGRWRVDSARNRSWVTAEGRQSAV